MLRYTTDRLRFDSAGDTLVGDLFRPVDAGPEPRPVVVVTGSWTTSKEQQAGFYARRLASSGIAAFAFDFRGFGQSAGTPRCWEHPQRKADDIGAAVGFVAGLPGVDRGRIGALGICASAGYQALNAVADERVASIAMVAPWLHDAERIAPYYGGAAGVAERIELSRRAQAKWESTGEVDHIAAISIDDPTAAMVGPYDYYLDPARGAIPEWDARIATMSWEPWLTFDAVALGPKLTAPVAMVHSRQGAVPDGAEAFYDGLTVDKSIEWIEGTQLDLYDQPAQVDAALAVVTAHFARTL